MRSRPIVSWGRGSALWDIYGAALVVIATVAGVASAQEETPKKAVRLEPVVVTATRTDLSTEPPAANVTVLDQEAVDTSANTAVDDILHTIPGFSLYRRSSSIVTSPDSDPEAQGVTLRGIGPSGSSRALVLVDGLPVIDAFSGQVFWGKISQEQIDHIEVVRGASASLWGNYAMAGVINIITKKPQETGAAVKVSYGSNNFTDNNLAITGHKDQLTVALDTNLFNTGGYPIVAASERGPIDGDAGSRHYTFNGRTTYTLSDNASVVLGGQFFDENYNLGTPQRKSWNQAGLIDLGGRLVTDDGSEWQAMLFSNMQTFQIQFTDVNESRTAEVRSLLQTLPYTDVGGSLVWSRNVLPQTLLTGGLDLHTIDGQSRDVFFDDLGQDIEMTQRGDGKQFFTGLFLQGIYTPTEQWVISLGGRVDLWSNYDGTLTTTPDVGAATHTAFGSQTKGYFNPRLSILYRATEWLDLRAAVYEAFRAPNLAELYRESRVEGLTLLPNPHLTPERLQGAEGGVDLPILENLDFRATGFWTQIQDPITFVDVDPDMCEGDMGMGSGHGGQEEEATCRKLFNLGLARTLGAEVEAVYKPTPLLTFYGSYLYANATLVRDPMDRDLQGNALAQIPPHTFTLGTVFSDPQLFTLRVEGRWVDEQFEDQENMESLASYVVINTSLSRALPFANGEAFIAAENLLNREIPVDMGGGILKIGTPLIGHGGVRFRF
ncbi:MAG TPA: TonB-dependent receptor [Candidatus Margulisiibacteriota bacterium]|nr:TonB-dependent receptor [Candidatus Margulisiibacteriota bacterium]